MIIENPEALKTWLESVLAPLCGADPASLAKYVVALVKKEKPESEITAQLDVFLQQETRGFVDKLFITLDSKSYLQTNPEGPAIVRVPTVDGGAIATTTTTERTKRKSFSPKSRSRSRSRDRSRRRRRSKSPARRSRSPRKFRCRDYDEKNYCIRGDLCPYDHGAVVLEEGKLSSMLKFHRPPPSAPSVGPPPPHMQGPLLSPPPGESYNPHASAISWPPPPYAAGFTRGPPGTSWMDGGAGYNTPPPFGHMSHLPPPPMGLLGPAPPPRKLICVPTNLPKEGGESVCLQLLTELEAGLENNGARRLDPTNCCLEVKNIPRGLNNISILSSHFGKYGKIVNLQVSFNGDVEGALVTFSTHAEAQAAYRSTEVVLINRFIRVFWHHQSHVPVIVDEAAAKEATGAREKEREKAVAAILKSQEILAAKEALKKKEEEQQRERTKLQLVLQRRKQELLDKQLKQQWVLIERLEKNKNSIKGDQRAVVMQTVRTLQESIETLKKDLSNQFTKKATSRTPSTTIGKRSLSLASQFNQNR